MGINRNIVECKYEYGHYIADSLSKELIETLWNVNTGTMRSESRRTVN